MTDPKDRCPTCGSTGPDDIPAGYCTHSWHDVQNVEGVARSRPGNGDSEEAVATMTAPSTPVTFDELLAALREIEFHTRAELQTHTFNSLERVVDAVNAIARAALNDRESDPGPIATAPLLKRVDVNEVDRKLGR